MKIEKVWLSNFRATEGLVVVIDVIRAFTTAAYAFHAGAEKIIPVLHIEDALSIHKMHPEMLLMGERKGEIIEGFHFGNSPVQFEGCSIQSATMIQRTTCGTQGVVLALEKADHLLVGSFVIAKATANRILQLAPKCVTLLMTSIHHGDEDAAFAEYLEGLLLGKNPDASSFLERVEKRPLDFIFPSDQKKQMEAIVDLDRFSFAIELVKSRPFPFLKPIYSLGEV